MCGIAGYWPRRNKLIVAEDPAILCFVNSLAHRGPDDVGVRIFSEDNLMLGHRRLSILDLSERGRQPLERVHGGRHAAIIFNGEIYNYLEIKNELSCLGYTFGSTSDTEVALYAYLEWGADAFRKFNGMWAMAIYEKNDGKLVLCRDRYGVKPLHYYFDGTAFAFASELKAFHHLPGLNLSVSEENLSAELAGIDLSPSSSTVLKDIYQLAAGHYLIFQRDKNQPQVFRWWSSLKHISQTNATYANQVEMFSSLFSDACQLRLRSDVPIATALSGGLDSSSVFSICAGLRSCISSQQTVNTGFVATFPGSDLDETEYATLVLDHFHGEGVFVENDINEIIAELDSALVALELISQIPSVISVYRLYKEMKSKGFAISIDGHGGDELLGGYLHFMQHALHDAFSPCINLKYYRQLLAIQNASSTPISQIKMANIQKINHWIGAVPAKPFIPGLYDDLHQMHNSATYQSSLNKALYLSFHYTSLPAILRNFDRASMANGIESRAPLLDFRLVSFVLSLPPTAKIGGPYSRRIFRDAMKGKLPETIRSRLSKTGFGAAFDQWLQKPVFQKWLLERIDSSEFRQSNYWDGESIARHCKKAIAEANHGELASAWPFISAHFALKGIT
jgi:asparagine synthase (glutamine-hydrolysing)